MADQNVELRLKLEGADKAAQEMERLARQTKGAGDAALQAEERYRRMNSAAGGAATSTFTPIPGGVGAGLRTFAPAGAIPTLAPPPPGVPWNLPPNTLAAQMQAAVARANAVIAAPTVPGGPGGGGGGGGSDIADRIVGRFSRIFFILSAAQRGFEGVGKGLEEASTKNLSYADSVRAVARNVAESIPFFGGLVKGLEQMGDALRGSPVQHALEFVAAGERQVSFAGRAAAARGRAEEGIFGLQRGVGDAAANQAAAEAGLAALTPGRLASFRDPGTGPAQQRLAEAEIAANAARGIVSGRATDFGLARTAREQAQTSSRAWQANLLAAEQRVGILGIPGPGEAIMPNFFNVGDNGPLAQRRKREDAQLQAQAQADVASKALVEARREEEQKLNTEKRRGLDLQKAQNESAAADLQLATARLGVRRSEVEQSRRSAEYAGGTTPGELQLQLQVARVVKAQGLGAVPPDLLAAAQQNPAMADFIRGEKERAGAANPFQQQIQAEFGKPGANQFDREIDEINTEAAKNKVEFAKAITTAATNGANDLRDTIAQILEAEISRAANELRLKFLQGKQ